MIFHELRVIHIVKSCNVILLIAAFVMPAARAEGTYAAIGYGQLKSEDIETGNIGLVIGSSPNKGVGFEFFYAPTKTATDDFNGYFKIKGGVAVVDLEFDFGDIGSIDDDTSGLAYGFTFGTQIGSGALEITYLILPEFDDFDGIEVDAEVNLFGIFYLWNFE